MKTTALALLATLLGAAAISALVVTRGADGPTIGNFTVERLAVPEVELVDQDNQMHALKGPLTDGKLLVINFNYTTCVSICPLGNDVMARLDDMLAADKPIRLMSITIDPRRDTPSLMRAAAESFDASERWSWLTGDPGEIERLLAAFDAGVANVELHEPIFLVGDLETGRFYRSLSMPNPTELAQLIDTLAL